MESSRLLKSAHSFKQWTVGNIANQIQLEWSFCLVISMGHFIAKIVVFESNSYTMVVNKWYTFYWNFVYKLLRGVWCIYSSYIACLFVNVRKFAIVFFVIKSTIYVAKVYKASIITISITSDLLYLNFFLARNGFLSLHKAMPNVISSKDVLHVNVQIDIWITNDRFCNFYALSCPVDDSTK